MIDHDMRIYNEFIAQTLWLISLSHRSNFERSLQIDTYVPCPLYPEERFLPSFRKLYVNKLIWIVKKAVSWSKGFYILRLKYLSSSMTFHFIYDHDSNVYAHKMKWSVEAVIKMYLVTVSLNKENY